MLHKVVVLTITELTSIANVTANIYSIPFKAVLHIEGTFFTVELNILLTQFQMLIKEYQISFDRFTRHKYTMANK